jgi:hypothetical protein
VERGALVVDPNPFADGPTGDFSEKVFVGRELQLAPFRKWLGAIDSLHQHACVVGRTGDGKTSFLQKASTDAVEAGVIACRVRLDRKGSAAQNINAIMEALLKAIDVATGLDLRRDWVAGHESKIIPLTHPG